MLNLLSRGRTTGTSGRELGRGTPLAPDLFELVGRGQPHWAGNINVFVGSKPVERHLAKALRIYQLLELPAGNFELATHPGLLVKDSYWRWPERNLAGRRYVVDGS